MSIKIKNKEKLILQLQEHIESVANIMCTKCGAVEIDYDEEMLSKKCSELGWKVTKNNCYCHDCAGKYLKIKN